MIERGVEYCDDCGLVVAAAGAHGCNRPVEATCGAKNAQCYDCVLECRDRTLAKQRDEIAALTRRAEGLYDETQRLYGINAKLHGHGKRLKRG